MQRKMFSLFCVKEHTNPIPIWIKRCLRPRCIQLSAVNLWERVSQFSWNGRQSIGIVCVYNTGINIYALADTSI